MLGKEQNKELSVQARRYEGGGHSGVVPPQMTACAPPNENCAPPSKDCAPKQLTDSGLLDCKSRPNSPKLVFTALEFVSKNCFFGILMNLHWISFKFWDEDLFFVFTSEFEKNRKNLETTTTICGTFETKTFF